jgi:hypothetical protein
MRVPLAGPILAIALAAGAAALAAADEPPLTVAVLRGDGILIPIATRQGDRWVNRWPEPRKRLSVPVRLGDLPRRWWGKVEPTGSWHAWLVDGTQTLATVQRPAWYPSLCRRGIGLQTDVTARPPLPPPDTSPYPKLGIAATTRLPFRRVETLEGGHRMGAALAAALARPVADAEARLYLQQHASENFRSAPDTPPHPSTGYTLTPPRSMPGTLRVERLYRVPVADRRSLIYYEAARRYPEPTPAPPPSPDCQGMTFASGWFVTTGDAVPDPLPVNIQLASCDYDGVLLLNPLGYMPTPRGALVIAEFTSWERELYVVLRARPDRLQPEMLLTTDGGRCNPD